jgi:hypothetical protein
MGPRGGIWWALITLPDFGGFSASGSRRCPTVLARMGICHAPTAHGRPKAATVDLPSVDHRAQDDWTSPDLALTLESAAE